MTSKDYNVCRHCKHLELPVDLYVYGCMVMAPLVKCMLAW